MNHPIELPGLREDLARDFLAAVGLLRLIDIKWPMFGAKLSWSAKEGYPTIHLSAPLPCDWCELVVGDIRSLERHPDSPLFHGDIIKTDHQRFRDAVRNAIRFRNESHPLAELPELMFAAYGGQVPDPKTGMIEPTMLSFANGQSGKSLLRDVRELIRVWDAEAMKHALEGVGKAVPGKSFRWAPTEFRPAAYRAHDPGSNVKGDEPRDHPSFNLLAFFGLSCFPSISSREGCASAALIRDESGWGFRWPVWGYPLSVSEVVALLSAPMAQVRSLTDLTRIWKSRRLVAEKSVYFASATLA